MNDQIEKVYNPKDFENKWFSQWESKKYFHAKADNKKDAYTIVIPPPNVTSHLHMGHGLNNTIQDVLIRWRRMQGKNAMWMPGCDHAGIATQNVVEKMLAAEESKSRHDYTREEFIAKVWEWKQKYGSLIIKQLKKMGSSCDWDRESFTMDEKLSKAVREVFVSLYEQGLLYKGNYMINWCPRCTTALSDEEVEHEDLKGALYYIKYPIKGEDNYVVVATTRPETMLGDSAVAINPEDERYKGLSGKLVTIPLAGRDIKVIADLYVKTDFGTGCLKITPAHDFNDFEIGNKYGLEKIVVMDEKGFMNNNVPEKYRGMDRNVARKEIVKDLKEKGYLEKIEDHDHAVGHCYRCSSVVEPYISDQWFVKMKPLAADAIKVVEEGKVKFYPEKYKKTYLMWMENIRDWCISRQIWWGHRIPAWYCKECGEMTVTREDPKTCVSCGSENIYQDSDVLDTWFSSWLWPFSTLGWPDKSEDLDYFYPGHVLSTAPEILFFWVARMIMAGLHFMGDVPFTDVYLHSTVCDDLGRKMSKSLGNGIDPLEVIEEYSADALRYTMLDLAPIGQRIKLSKDKFQTGHRFANKIWNASRYILMNLDQKYISSISNVNLDITDKWILSKLSSCAAKIDDSLTRFRFNDATYAIFDFIWHDFCDWYVEFSKSRLYKGSDEEKKSATSVLLYVLDNALRLLHPIMPFITEEIWQKLPVKKEAESIMISSFPVYDKSLVDKNAEELISSLIEIIRGARNIRGDAKIQPHIEADIYIKAQDDKILDVAKNFEGQIKALAKSSSVKCSKDMEKPLKSAVYVGEGFEIYIPLEGLIDFDKEKAKIEKEIEKNEKDLKATRAKLGNSKFTNNAPPAVIEKEKSKENEFLTNLERLKENLKKLI
jgi:valyl-tRNA synthetase